MMASPPCVMSLQNLSPDSVFVLVSRRHVVETVLPSGLSVAVGRHALGSSILAFDHPRAGSSRHAFAH